MGRDSVLWFVLFFQKTRDTSPDSGGGCGSVDQLRAAHPRDAGRGSQRNRRDCGAVLHVHTKLTNNGESVVNIALRNSQPTAVARIKDAGLLFFPCKNALGNNPILDSQHPIFSWESQSDISLAGFLGAPACAILLPCKSFDRVAV